MSHTITVITPNIGAIAASVVITGTGFGATRGTSTVSFNGTSVVSYTSWADTSLTVVVPAGTTSGRVVVTIASVANTGTNHTWFMLRDSSITTASGIKAQDQTQDTSDDDLTIANAKDLNRVIQLVMNLTDLRPAYVAIGDIGSSGTTGTLRAAPVFAIFVAGNGNVVSIGWSSGTTVSSAVQSSVRMLSNELRVGGTHALTASASTGLDDNPSNWNTTAFSSAGITLTRASGSSSAHGVRAIIFF